MPSFDRYAQGRQGRSAGRRGSARSSGRSCRSGRSRMPTQKAQSDAHHVGIGDARQRLRVEYHPGVGEREQRQEVRNATGLCSQCISLWEGDSELCRAT